MKLLNGDCMQLMKEIPDGAVDLILCDPPYGTTANKWDTSLDLKKLWTEYERIIKTNGCIVLFSQMPFTAELVMSNPRLFRYEWIWEKEQGTGFLNAKKMPLKIHENILVFYKRLPTYNPQMRTGFKPYTQTQSSHSSNYGKAGARPTTTSNGERYPIDLLRYSRQKDRGLHPTQKPVPLLEYLVRTYTNEGDTVLDNCMGSGSTGVAVKRVGGRHFIGIEQNKVYFDIARERIEKEPTT